MINEKNIQTKINTVLEGLSGEKFAETRATLIAFKDAPDCNRLYELAVNIQMQDRQSAYTEGLMNLLEELLATEIEKGNADAMNDLGALYYEDSRGFPQNYAEAMRYYHMAAENGSRQAQENLGYCYYYGRDGERDYEKAFHYFALGAFDGHLISLYKIGDMYLNGYYVPENEREAYCIYVRCAQSFEEDTPPVVVGAIFYRLGNMFLNGWGTEQNVAKALICYHKAEENLYRAILDGDTMYKKTYYAAINGQAEARKIMMKKLEEN